MQRARRAPRASSVDGMLRLWEMAPWVSSVWEGNRPLWRMPSSTRSAAGNYAANLATVAWCTAMVLAIDRQLSPAARRFRASACWCAVSLGLGPNRVPLALAGHTDEDVINR